MHFLPGSSTSGLFVALCSWRGYVLRVVASNMLSCGVQVLVTSMFYFTVEFLIFSACTSLSACLREGVLTFALVFEATAALR